MISNYQDLPRFTTFTTGWGSFKETTSLSLSGIWFEYSLIRSSKTHHIHNRREFILPHNLIEFIEYFDLNIHWLDLPQFTTFTTGAFSFFETTSLSLSSIWFDYCLIGSFSIHHIHNRREFILLHNLIEFIKYLIWIVIDLIFLNSPHSQQERNLSRKQPHWVYRVFWFE